MPSAATNCMGAIVETKRTKDGGKAIWRNDCRKWSGEALNKNADSLRCRWFFFVCYFRRLREKVAQQNQYTAKYTQTADQNRYGLISERDRRDQPCDRQNNITDDHKAP